jgi:Arc/MetJ-type ribon-helix-helix transcriptional regulator
MSDTSTDVQKVTVRLYGNDQNALDTVIEESDDWGNKSDAIRGLLRQAARGEVAADGGPATGPEIVAPDDESLRAIYEHALAVANDSLRLAGTRLGDLAKAVNNDGETNLSPDAESIGTELRRLERAEFARRTFAGTPDGKGHTDWIIKPPQATPAAWIDAPSNHERIREARDAWRAGDEDRALSLVDDRMLLAAVDGGEA